MKLYEINAKMEELMEKWEACIDQETGEIMDDVVFDIEEELTKLQLDRDEKIEDCACYYKGLLAEKKCSKGRRAESSQEKASSGKQSAKLKGVYFSCPWWTKV